MDSEAKLNIIKALRQETGCGMMAITQCVDSLIYSLKHKPKTKMDVGLKLKMEWEEYEMRTTATKYTMIWVDSKDDTKDFAPIFERLQGELLKNPSRYQVNQVLKAHPERPLLVCGHGDSTGVYNEDMTDYVLDKLNVHLIKELPYVIGIWCYAGNFADHYHLRGFFTSMFISNYEEAVACGFGTANPETITKENLKFAERINLLIHNQTPLKEWPVFLQQLANLQNLEPDEAFVGYNYEAMSWFDSK